MNPHINLLVLNVRAFELCSYPQSTPQNKTLKNQNNFLHRHKSGGFLFVSFLFFKIPIDKL